MAAGMGTRFAGGVKQLQPVGPGGEVLMEYSIHDALEAGFNRIIFIIRHDIEELFETTIGARISSVCRKRGVSMEIAYQERENLPEGFVLPEDRKKPWGTGHALLSCKHMLHGNFAVINADDYYGKDAYAKASAFLDRAGGSSVYGLVGFSLGNTLSENGGVTRGVCQVDSSGWLKGLEETHNIIKTPQGAAVDENGTRRYLSDDVPVSMNMWAFTPDVLDVLEQRFTGFLTEHVNDADAEFLIPVEIGAMVQEGNARIQVLPTDSHWIGMTYAEDLQTVRNAFARMVEQKIYTSPLE